MVAVANLAVDVTAVGVMVAVVVVARRMFGLLDELSREESRIRALREEMVVDE